jgi:FkbM family methyltransferase
MAGNFNYYSQKVYFPKKSVIFRRAVKEGIYEHAILGFILPLIKPGTEVFDIGANIGLMAIPFLSVNNSVKVISAEASPNSLPFLKKTQEASTFKDRWLIIDKAIAEKPGKINFHIASSENGAYDSINNTQRINFKNTIEIDSTTIDLVWQNRHEPQVSFIKIDIEGADLLALKGAVSCIGKCRPSIAIEWNAINIKPFDLKNSDLFDFVQSINYTLYALPYLNKIFELADLELHSKYTENFLLIPNANT